MTLRDRDARRLLEAARVPPESAAGKAWRARYCQALPDREIAARLGCKVGTVWAHVSKANREIRELRGR
jgi:DNA-directed RNA polymerase specialized sigma24 family protein